MFLSSWDKERANGNLRAALAALAHGLEVAARLLKSATARMLPILVVHGQLDDERGVTCHFASLACSLRPLFQTAGGRWHPRRLLQVDRGAGAARLLAPELRYSSARRTRSERVTRSWQ